MTSAGATTVGNGLEVSAGSVTIAAGLHVTGAVTATAGALSVTGSMSVLPVSTATSAAGVDAFASVASGYTGSAISGRIAAASTSDILVLHDTSSVLFKVRHAHVFCVISLGFDVHIIVVPVARSKLMGRPSLQVV